MLSDPPTPLRLLYPALPCPTLPPTPSRTHAHTVYTDGNICLDILKSAWTPINDISAILISIQSLLNDPNPNSPANNEAATLYTENRREYHKRVRATVEGSWDGMEEADVIDVDEGAEKEDDAVAAVAAAAPPPPLTVLAAAGEGGTGGGSGAGGSEGKQEGDGSSS